MIEVEGYLLDTSIASPAWYAGHKRHKEVRERLEGLGDDTVFVSDISKAEVEYGLNLVALDAQKHDGIRSAMGRYKVVPIDHHTAQTYGEIRATIFKAYAPRDRRNKISSKYVEDLRERTSGKELGIQENDLWIVSVAVRYNLLFLTADGRGGMRKIIEAANYAHRTEYWN